MSILATKTKNLRAKGGLIETYWSTTKSWCIGISHPLSKEALSSYKRFFGCLLCLFLSFLIQCVSILILLLQEESCINSSNRCFQNDQQKTGRGANEPKHLRSLAL